MQQISNDYEIIAKPFPGGQTILLAASNIHEIMYGGERGAAKSHGLLLDWLKFQSKHGDKAKGLFFRRKFTDIQDLIQRANVLFADFNAKWTNATDKSATFAFPNGASLKFGHLNNDAAWTMYKGQEFTRLYVDEADEFPNFEPIQLLLASARSTAGIPCCLRLSSNPGGIGNSWIKERYIDPMPPYTVLKSDEPDPVTGETTTRTRMFIIGRLHENPLLNTPEYRRQIKESASTPAMYEAWAHGNYNLQAGAFFDCLHRDRHVIPSFIVPAHWPRICAYDPGSGHPSAVVYLALVCEDEPWRNPRRIGGDAGAYALERIHRYKGNLPVGALVLYREIYFAKKAGGAGSKWTGLQLPYQQQAKEIVARERYQEIYGVRYPEQLDQDGMVKHAYRTAGRDIVNELGRISIQRIMAEEGLKFHPANRTGDERLRATGWNQIRHRAIGENNKPMLYFMEHCIHTWRTITSVVIDPDKQEDVLKKQDDDLPDALRMGCQCRPYQSSFDTPSDFFPAQGNEDGTITVLPPPLPGRQPIPTLPDYDQGMLDGF